MKPNDEKFLKEVLWSEAWFPWKKKNAIFVRGQERSKTELLALILSALALIVSALATVGTWKQTDLMQEQLTSAERNAGKMRIFEAVMASCRAIQFGPVRARQWKVFIGPDGKPAKIPMIDDKPFVLTRAQREAYANTLEDVKLALNVSSMYLMFLDGAGSKFYEKAVRQTLKSMNAAIDVADSRAGDLDYIELRRISDTCYSHIEDAFIETAGADSLREERSFEMDDLMTHVLSPNPAIPDALP